jgi:hypothetical protein
LPVLPRPVQTFDFSRFTSARPASRTDFDQFDVEN